MRKIYQIIIITLALIAIGCIRKNVANDLERADAMIRAGERAAALAALDSIDLNDLDAPQIANLHFMRGTCFDEYSHIDSAVFCIRRALREADKCGADSISHKAALYMAYLSNIAGNHTLAVNYGRLALKLAEKRNNPRWIGSDCLQLSGSYFAKGMLDSSDYFIERLVPILEHQDNRDLPDMLNNIAVSRMMQGDINGARFYLERSISLSPNEHSYYLMAETYVQEGHNDSAEIMWQKALTGNDLYLQSRISNAYAQWLTSIGERERAADIMLQSRHLKDSLDVRNLSEKAFTAHLSDERREYESAAKRKSVWLIAILSLFFVVMAALWIIMRRKSRIAAVLTQSADSLSDQMLEMEHQMAALRTEIDLLKGQCERHNKDARELEHMVHEKSRQLRQLEQKYSDKEHEMKKTTSKLRKMVSDHDEVSSVGRQRYCEIMADGKAIQWTKHDMTMFLEYYYLMHPEFALSVSKDYGKLSPSLAMILVLEDMDFSQEKIQASMGMSGGAFRTARSRINAARAGGGGS